MNHSKTAIEISRSTGWDLDGYAESRGWSGVSIGPVGRHRDSDAHGSAPTFEVIYGQLSALFADDIDEASFGHWGFGWVAELAWNTGNGDLASEVESWTKALANYPVADEMHCSQLEWEDNHPSENECYSDDPDCRCGN